MGDGFTFRWDTTTHPDTDAMSQLTKSFKLRHRIMFRNISGSRQGSFIYRLFSYRRDSKDEKARQKNTNSQKSIHLLPVLPIGGRNGDGTSPS